MSQANLMIEGYCLLITIILQISNFLSTRNKLFTKKTLIMRQMLFTNAVLIAVFIVVVLIDGKVQYSVLNNIGSGICYALGIMLTELFGEYVFAIISEKGNVKQGIKYTLRIVCTIAMILDIFSIYNGMYFTTVNGFHVRGAYYLVNQIIALAIIMGQFIYLLFRVKDAGKDAVSLSMYCLIPALAVLGQIYITDIVLMYPAVTLAIFIIYIVSYVNQGEQLNEKNAELTKAMEVAEEAKKEAQQANFAKSEFLSSMSHDIRTPLNAIIGMTNMAIENIDDKKEALENLSVVKTSSKHLLSLVNDVLDLSMIESGKISIAQKEFILPDLVKEIQRMAWPLTKAKNQTFVLDVDDFEHDFFIGDMPRIKQILVNFLSNAVKYTPSGGTITLKVNEVYYGNGTSDIIMACRDNGIGIDTDTQKHIFEPFVREVKSTVNPVEGTGLGLAIVSNIVNAMNGTLQLVSEKGMGSIFTATIPLKIADEKELIKQFDDVKDYKVLFVVDEGTPKEAIQAAYAKELNTSQKCDVVIGREVLNNTAVYGEQYNAIISICIKNTVSVIRALRKQFPHTYIIYGIQMEMMDQEKNVLDAGASAVLYRPVFRTTLLEEFQKIEILNRTAAEGERYLNGKTILVVEDQPINAMIIEHMLKNAGAIVFKATNGMEAVDMFMGSAPGQYDVIMMDIMMPVMNGYDATRKIRNLNRKDALTVPIVAMTANAFAEDIAKSKEMGMDAHLSKPLDAETVKTTLLSLLNPETE